MLSFTSSRIVCKWTEKKNKTQRSRLRGKLKEIVLRLYIVFELFIADFALVFLRDAHLFESDRRRFSVKNIDLSSTEFNVPRSWSLVEWRSSTDNIYKGMKEKKKNKTKADRRIQAETSRGTRFSSIRTTYARNHATPPVQRFRTK